MKQSFQSRFTLGIIFLFLIILVLAVSSGYIMNKISAKTDAILKENYLSLAYAREMAEGIKNVNQELVISFLENRNPDDLKLTNELASIDASLIEEKNNITEPEEGNLVLDIEAGYGTLKDTILTLANSRLTPEGLLAIQNKSGDLSAKLLTLSQINGKALEDKTDDAKASIKRAWGQISILTSICILIGFSFTFSFTTYFNRQFFQLYNGIKGIAANNYNEPFYFEGNNEFYEISVIFNEMVDKIKGKKPPLPEITISSKEKVI